MIVKVNLKNVGLSVGILACIYLMYTLIMEDDCRCTANVKWNEVNLKTVTLQDPSGKAKVYDVVLINNKSETSYTNISKTNVESIKQPIDTVLDEVENVPEFADDQLDIRTLPKKQYRLYELFWKYTMVESLQHVCSNQVRFGPKGDTGYDVCLDEPYRPGKPCIVYSFGSLFMFGFEEYAIKHHLCEVHTYDPSIPIAKHKIPQGVNFHLVGLGDNITTNSKGWNMQTFSDIRRTLNHKQKTIDVLKIDIEGGEWVSLAHALQSNELRFVKQLQIELHLWGQKRVGMSLVGKLRVLKGLYDKGFRIFHHEPWPTNDCNRLMRPPHSKITLCVILSLVNTKYQPN